ncbi:Yip1 family protein [Halobaculum limi]|uniref:Yip1 family protein n=1 Tax=Halobaculum limi TaxID=3031916 RepID=UPI002404BEC1|nr:Yip1 family protein [Halobaculum sp. YSMS11]
MAGPRTPLLRPHRYFRRHDGSPPLAHAVAVVAVVTVAVAGGIAVFLGEFAAALDMTTTVDNPAYPGDAFCENSAFEDTPTGCSEPKTVEREVGALVTEELSWVPAAALVAVPLFWLFEAGVLHAASALAGGDGPFRDTLAISGWAMAPALVRLAAVGGFLVYQLRTVALSGSVDGAIDALQAAIAGVQTVSLAAALVVGVWGGIIRAYGISEARDHPVREAALVVAVLTVLGLLYELV